ncbi:uncharacterized protein N7458_002579 [Penicillium daleae]|uniref:Protein kinase domain-containing protein n=1 Tax=Penicillium daleae TaxID=63821 RepID=A0AAD6CFF4_9EURO|nr:uncharacterized protein N7458_002579 [Penicillium daleae]KAJ5461027.1 hypothetical protein N7458_002579 [Penicillium daleae]
MEMNCCLPNNTSSNEHPLTREHGLPHLEHPSEKYSLNWKINQAGLGWLSLGNYFGYSTVLIKVRKIQKPQNGFPMLQPAFHPNIIGLVEAFYDEGVVYLTYNYSGLVVSLAQVVSTPTVKVNELEIATICWDVLRGLEYLHKTLDMGHGNIDSSNIVLFADGTIKIANIGDSMLEDTQTSFIDDRESLASLLLGLDQPTNHVSRVTGEQTHKVTLSTYALHFIENLGPASYSYLFEVGPKEYYLDKS